MQRCPTCNRTYPDAAPPFCPQDAMRLVNDAANSNLPPTMVSPAYGDAQQQQYAPQQYPPPQQQWSAPQSQWNIPPANQSGNRNIILAAVGLVLVIGIGLGIYFLTRSGSSSTSETSSSNGSSSSSGTSSSSGSKSSTSSSRFVGTWVKEGQDPNDEKSETFRFTGDGKIYQGGLVGGGERLLWTYTVNGNTANLKVADDPTGSAGTATLESDNRMQFRGDPYVRK